MSASGADAAPVGSGATDATAAVVVTSSLRPRDSFRVAATIVLRNRLSGSLLILGPAMWTFGTITRSAAMSGYGARMSLLIVAVPIFAALVGSYTAYRPGSSELYEPATWTFAPEGIEIEQRSRRAHASWDEFSSWRLVDDCYLLNTDRRRYVMVSVRQVTAPERARLEALLEAKLGRRRR